MIVEMGDYAWSEHIVTVFLALPSKINWFYVFPAPVLNPIFATS
jgi:hypothetical protein